MHTLCRSASTVCERGLSYCSTKSKPCVCVWSMGYLVFLYVCSKCEFALEFKDLLAMMLYFDAVTIILFFTLPLLMKFSAPRYRFKGADGHGGALVRVCAVPHFDTLKLVLMDLTNGNKRSKSNQRARGVLNPVWRIEVDEGFQRGRRGLPTHSVNHGTRSEYYSTKCKIKPWAGIKLNTHASAHAARNCLGEMYDVVKFEQAYRHRDGAIVRNQIKNKQINQDYQQRSNGYARG